MGRLMDGHLDDGDGDGDAEGCSLGDRFGWTR
jgi:hypothetical protein